MKVNWREQQQGGIRDIVCGRVQGTQKGRDGREMCMWEVLQQLKVWADCKASEFTEPMGCCNGVSLGTGCKSFIQCFFDVKQLLNE